jgi:pterin-4a-carbinolamine dehydratase
MPADQAEELLPTLSRGWRLSYERQSRGKGPNQGGSGDTAAITSGSRSSSSGSAGVWEEGDGGGDEGKRQAPLPPPSCLVREFAHPTFGAAGRFASLVAQTSEVQAHYPESLLVERRVVRRSWTVTTTVRCRTTVLGGLSLNDFHLAMVRARARAVPVGRAGLQVIYSSCGRADCNIYVAASELGRQR